MGGENQLKILITKQRETDVKNFEKLFSSHIYAVATNDFEFENYKHNVVPACHGVRETIGEPGKESRPVEEQNKPQIKDSSQHIFKKREVPKKGVAKAFSKVEKKTTSVKKEADEKSTTKKEVPKSKSNKQVNSFFGKKTSTLSKTKKQKNEPEENVEDKEEPEQAMEVDQEPDNNESDEEPLVKKRKSPRKKTKHRRIQMESSSDEDETEGEKLLFGDSQEERLKNISLDDDKVLAEDTIRSDSSEHE